MTYSMRWTHLSGWQDTKHQISKSVKHSELKELPELKENHWTNVKCLWTGRTKAAGSQTEDFWISTDVEASAPDLHQDPSVREQK